MQYQDDRTAEQKQTHRWLVVNDATGKGEATETISLRDFDYSTDGESGEVEAASLAEAYQTLREKITDAQIADGATLWVEDSETGERWTMGQDGEAIVR